jgi:hypothetical protein
MGLHVGDSPSCDAGQDQSGGAGCEQPVNRLVRIREWGPHLFGRAQNRWRVRTSNAYTFIDPQVSMRPRN